MNGFFFESAVLIFHQILLMSFQHGVIFHQIISETYWSSHFFQNAKFSVCCFHQYFPCSSFILEKLWKTQLCYSFIMKLLWLFCEMSGIIFHNWHCYFLNLYIINHFNAAQIVQNSKRFSPKLGVFFSRKLYFSLPF